MKIHDVSSSRARRLSSLRPDPLARRSATRWHRDRPVTRVVARALDIVLSSVALMILAVPLAVLAILVKATSRGPVIYHQQRTGMGGRPFTIYKFRTMYVGAEDGTGPVWAKRGDTRCTALGAIMRRTSLDELPQLFNILCGDMSIVGPRPERPYFVDIFSQRMPRYDERHNVRPGLTGWAQVNGCRGDTSIEKRLELDLHYVQHWSVGMNLWIMLRTPLAVLIDKNGC